VMPEGRLSPVARHDYVDQSGQKQPAQDSQHAAGNG